MGKGGERKIPKDGVTVISKKMTVAAPLHKNAYRRKPVTKFVTELPKKYSCGSWKILTSVQFTSAYFRVKFKRTQFNLNMPSTA